MCTLPADEAQALRSRTSRDCLLARDPPARARKGPRARSEGQLLRGAPAWPGGARLSEPHLACPPARFAVRAARRLSAVRSSRRPPERRQLLAAQRCSALQLGSLPPARRRCAGLCARPGAVRFAGARGAALPLRIGPERSSAQRDAQGGCAQDRARRKQECAPHLAPARCMLLTVACAAVVQARSLPRRWWCVAASGLAIHQAA